MGLFMNWRAIAPILLLASAASTAVAQNSTSFEGRHAGPLTRHEQALGVWTARKGHAEINADHTHSGSRALRIFGGEDRSVELEIAKDLKVSKLRFWAERWTEAGPFQFHVVARAMGKWEEVYDGSKAIRVGGYLVQAEAVLPEGTTRLRFTCTAPASAGILIDDVMLSLSGPMQVLGVTTVQPVLPVLRGKDKSPVARVDISVTGDRHGLDVRELCLNFKGTTDLADIKSVVVLRGPENLGFRLPDELLHETDRLGRALRVDAATLSVQGELRLKDGVNHLWICVLLAQDADIDHAIDVGCVSVVLSDGTTHTPDITHPEGAQRMGVSLRDGGDAGVHTYRIPGLATTPEGTLLGIYDIRHRSGGDLPGHIDVGLSRSTDGGQSWEKMRTIMDAGSDPKWRHDGVGDPAILVDQETGHAHVLAVWSHGNRGWNGSGPGLTPAETGQLMLTTSEDDGRTWSALRNLTTELKRPEWSFLLQGPGRGITMADGTLVFPAQFQDTPAKRRMPHSTIVYSKDHGATWHIGTGARANTTESAVVETTPGTLMLNMRDNRGGSRAVMTTEDLGQTWIDHPSTRSLLPEPVCMASLVNIGTELRDPRDTRLLFSNPNVSNRPRRAITIQLSPDHGNTWPPTNKLLLDAGPSAGYSCLTMIDANTIGILYESSRAHLAFQRIPLAALNSTDH
jgi:sialidase-1